MTISSAERYALDRMNSTALSVGLGRILHSQAGRVLGQYNFATQGGASGSSYQLKDVNGNPLYLPSSAIVTHVFVHVTTAFTSGGAATAQLDSEGSADLLAATAKGSLTLNALVAGIPDNTVANMKRMTAQRAVNLTVATASLTAGALNAWISYVLA